MIGCGTEPPLPPATIEIQSSSDTVKLHEPLTVTAVVLDAHGGVPDAAVSWTADGGNSSIEPTGLWTATVTALDSGQVTVTAHAGDAVGHKTLYACAPIYVYARNSAAMIVGRTTTLFASGYRSDITALQSPQTVKGEWTSSKPSVIHVSGDAATAVATGTATLTVHAGCGASDTTFVTVMPDGYRLTVIDVPGSTSDSAVALNDSDWVVGIAHVQAGASQPFLWRQGIVDNLSGCQPIDINNAGQILCQSTRPTVWQNGTVSQLDTVTLSGRMLNDSTHILGDGTVGNTSGVWIWRPNTSATQLVGNPYYYRRFNNHDDLAAIRGGLLYPQAYVARAGGPLTPLAGVGYGRWSEIGDMNDSADVVGTSEYRTGNNQPVVQIWRASSSWKASALVQRDPTVLSYANDLATSAASVNNLRQIVGRGGRGTYVWSETTGLALLNAILADTNWDITKAQRINDRGHILARAVDKRTGTERPVLLTPP